MEGYELKEWRYGQFGTWLFDNYLLDFALTHSDCEKISQANAVERILAALRIVNRHSIKIKGSLDATGNLDKLLLTIRNLNIEGLNISSFEREILEDVKTQV